MPKNDPIKEINNYQVQIDSMPHDVVMCHDYRDLLDFVGPDWPVFVAQQGMTIGPNSTPAHSDLILIRHDSQWFGAYVKVPEVSV